MSAQIVIENVTKRYGDLVAVNGISLSVSAGEIFGFLGVNGAGKTTTLRMLAGILQPTSGRIVLGGYDLKEMPREAKSITGYIPDRPHLYNKLTGREFLYFCADLYSVPFAEAEERIDALLEKFSLLDWQDDLIESYSHGMKQRLATCSALVHDPDILVIDEPIVGLDPHGARLLKNSLREYARSGMAIILSTHSLNVAEEVSDRLGIIHRGALITMGTLAEIRSETNSHDKALEDVFIELTSASEQS
jgi:ABC-2 type transport system ATP-binding protein